MKISNKLNSKDFVELQKIVMEKYEPGKSTIFLMRYLVNFLYAVLVILGSYYLLIRFKGTGNFWLPVILGILTFTVLVLFFPRIYRKRMNRTIERFYGRTVLDIQREITLDQEGFTAVDSKGERTFSWSDFESAVRSSGNYYLKRKGQAEGYVLKADQLSREEVQTMEDLIQNAGLTLEDRRHE